MTPEEIVSLAREQGIQLVRFLYCDNGGVIRGKSAHVGQLARRMSSGIGLVLRAARISGSAAQPSVGSKNGWCPSAASATIIPRAPAMYGARGPNDP